MSEGTTGLGILEQALANMPVLVSTWEGDPQATLTSNSIRYQGALPRMMLNTFDNNAQISGSRTVSPRLSQRNALTHVQSGSTHRSRRMSIATRDTTDSFCSAQCPDGTNHGYNNHAWESRTPLRHKRPLDWLK